MSVINFPFFQTLSQEAQNALRIVERMKETGESLARAAKWVTGRSWQGARLTRGLTSVSETLAEFGVRHAAAEALVTEGTQLAATAAGAGSAAAAGGGLLGGLGTIGGWFGLTGAAAAVAGGLLVTGVLAAATYGAVRYLGNRAGDTRVQEGPVMTGRQPRQPFVEPKLEVAPVDSTYFIVRPTGSHILSIRTVAAMEKGIPQRSFRHGGTSSEKAPLDKVDGPFVSAWVATEKLATMLTKGTLRRTPLAAGKQAKDTSGAWATIDDFGEVDMSLLEKLNAR